MAEAAGDVLVLATARGRAEAKRMGRGEAGASRWCIRHPWGTETFYGTAEQVMAYMQKRVAEQQDARERDDEGIADGLVVRGPHPVANMAGAERAGMDEQFAEPGHRPDDLVVQAGGVRQPVDHGAFARGGLDHVHARSRQRHSEREPRKTGAGTHVGDPRGCPHFR